MEVAQPEFFDTTELAQYLGVSRKAVIKWRQARRIPGAVRCGRVWRFRRTEIEKRLLSGELLLDDPLQKCNDVD